MVEIEEQSIQLRYNFSKIIKTNVQENQFDYYQKLFSSLPQYDEKANKKGFLNYKKDIIVDHVIQKEGYPVIIDIGPKIIKKRFHLKENDSLYTADIFWNFEYNLFLIRGSEKMAQEVMSKLRLIFKGLDLEEIVIENDFLMWIASQYSTTDGKLSNDLFIDQIDQGGTIKSQNSKFKSRVNEMILRKGHRTDLSLPAIYGLVNDHEFSLIGGDFVFEETTINLKLTTKNNIYAYSNEKDLKGLSPEEKYGLLFPMLNEIVRVIYYWDSLDNEHKYPDDKYMETMSKSFEDQVIECRENLKKLKIKYAKKRKDVT